MPAPQPAAVDAPGPLHGFWEAVVTRSVFGVQTSCSLGRPELVLDELETTPIETIPAGEVPVGELEDEERLAAIWTLVARIWDDCYDESIMPPISALVTRAPITNAIATTHQGENLVIIDAAWLWECATVACRRLWATGDPEFSGLEVVHPSHALVCADKALELTVRKVLIGYVLAHEIGHILYAHLDRRADIDDQWLKEMEADSYGGALEGRIAQRAGLDQDLALRSMQELWGVVWTSEISSHPDSARRMLYLQEGFLFALQYPDESQETFEALHEFRLARSDFPKKVTHFSLLHQYLDEEEEWRPTSQQLAFAEAMGVDVVIEDDLGMEFVLIPPGHFQAGSYHADDEDRYVARISRGFYLQTTEVTQAQWLRVMRSNPSRAQVTRSFPLETVSWEEAVEFCNHASRDANLDPSFSIQGTDIAFRGFGYSGYRLPTEAEWEYACRAGSDQDFFFGGFIDRHLACYAAEGPGEVGRFRPNDFGLYDMHGNVAEWCLDEFLDNVAGGGEIDELVDPLVYKGNRRQQVIRGGGWNSTANECRSSFRSWRLRTEHYSDVGLRLVLPLITDTTETDELPGAEPDTVREDLAREVKRQVTKWLTKRRYMMCDECGEDGVRSCSPTVRYMAGRDANGWPIYRTRTCSRCSGRGQYDCPDCVDGISTEKSRELLEDFRAQDSPLKGYKRSKTVIMIDESLKRATATCWVKHRGARDYVDEVSVWVLEGRTWVRGN